MQMILKPSEKIRRDKVFISKLMKIVMLIIPAIIMFIGQTDAQHIEASITGIRSKNGQIVLSVYKDDESFQKEKPMLVKKYKKTMAPDGSMTIHIQLEKGVYGIAFLDDENNDSEMNYSFIGMPKEGFGFSNYEFKGMSKPKFEQFKFTLNQHQKLKLQMKVKYL